jgi:hypothetical protein
MKFVKNFVKKLTFGSLATVLVDIPAFSMPIAPSKLETSVALCYM